MLARMRYLSFSIVGALLAVAVWYGVAHHHTASMHRLPATMEEFKQRPGGTVTVQAGEFLIGLAKEGKLPGFSSGEHGAMQSGAPDTVAETYPVTRAVHFSKDGDTSDYLYLVVRESQDAPWKLLKGARMDAGGHVIQEYVVP
jgi:hypothetical protein